VLENSTGVRTYAYTADVDRQHAVAALRRMRAAIRRGADVPAASLTARATPKVTTVRAVAPLRVEGELRARRDTLPKRFSAVLGDGSATRLRLVFDRRLPLLTLRVHPIPPRRMLASDRGNGLELFDRAFAAMRTLARVRQYQQFLINPDPLGRSHATYIYRTAAATRERLAPVQPRDSNSAGTVVAVVLLAASAAGLAVVWAHS
jgi:hypothetical protein